MSDAFIPRPEHKFSFGLGRSAIAAGIRSATPSATRSAAGRRRRAARARSGAWGVNLHDNDLVPIDATPAERDRIVVEFKRACERHGIVVPMATVNLFFDPVFRDGAFTRQRCARPRATRVQKTMRAMDLGAELGAKIFVLWGGREGTETDACRRPDEAINRLREAVNYLCEYSLDRRLRLPVRARSQAERAARRHLHGDDRRLPRIHPDARASGDGRRQSRRSRTSRWRG